MGRLEKQSSVLKGALPALLHHSPPLHELFRAWARAICKGRLSRGVNGAARSKLDQNHSWEGLPRVARGEQ